MKSYLEIEITAREREQELLIPTMLELGCEGFQQTDSSLLCYMAKPAWNESRFESLKSEIKRILNIVSVNNAIRFREIEDENWNESWERTIQPIEIGTRFVVKPSWATYEGSKERIVLQIDPKMSFGTGYHETTRLTLSLIEKYLVGGVRMLDVGTGTGILAIAAAKLGASSAEGIDNDDWSIENALENVEANGQSSKVHISKKLLSEFPDASFGMITANLTLNTNLEFMTEFVRLLMPPGILLLSGLLAHDKAKMVDRLVKSGFEVREIVAENEWIAISASLSG